MQLKDSRFMLIYYPQAGFRKNSAKTKDSACLQTAQWAGHKLPRLVLPLVGRAAAFHVGRPNDCGDENFAVVCKLPASPRLGICRRPSGGTSKPLGRLSQIRGDVLTFPYSATCLS